MHKVGKLFRVEMNADNRWPYETVTSLYDKNKDRYPDKDLFVINGDWFSGTKFIGNLKVDGRVLSKEWDSSCGFFWDQGKLPSFGWNSMEKDNQVSTLPIIFMGEIQYNTINAQTDGVKRLCPRTWWGFDKQGNHHIEVTTNNYTLEDIAERMIELGIFCGIVLDSGGSSKLKSEDTFIDLQQRNIMHHILLWFDKEEIIKEETENMKKVCIDFGHGGNENYNASPDRSYYEHEAMLDIGMRLKDYLEPYVEVVTTREIDTTVSLATRAYIANVNDCDAFVSLHSNATGGTGWSSARGLCVYTYGAGETQGRNILANGLLDAFKKDGITILNNGLYHNSGFYVLAYTNMPAVLIEYGFHTNEQDTELLKTSEYRERLAKQTAEGILEYFGITMEDTPEVPETPEVPQSEVADYAQKSWSKFTDLGILDGTRPLDNMPRQDVAVVLDRFENHIMSLVCNNLIKGGELDD